MPVSQIIGLDLGMSKTGLARASSVARLVEPLNVVPTTGVLATLAELENQQPIEAVVVGLPRNLSGQDTDQTTWVRQWVADAKTTLNTSFYWQDEALTSQLAVGKLQTSKFKHQKMGEDAVAAAVILQDFLDSAEANRVRC